MPSVQHITLVYCTKDIPFAALLLGQPHAWLTATLKMDSSGNSFYWTNPSYSGDNKISVTIAVGHSDVIDMPFEEVFGPDVAVQYKCLNGGREFESAGYDEWTAALGAGVCVGRVGQRCSGHCFHSLSSFAALVNSMLPPSH